MLYGLAYIRSPYLSLLSPVVVVVVVAIARQGLAFEMGLTHIQCITTNLSVYYIQYCICLLHILSQSRCFFCSSFLFFFFIKKEFLAQGYRIRLGYIEFTTKILLPCRSINERNQHAFQSCAFLPAFLFIIQLLFSNSCSFLFLAPGKKAKKASKKAVTKYHHLLIVSFCALRCAEEGSELHLNGKGYR